MAYAKPQTESPLAFPQVDLALREWKPRRFGLTMVIDKSLGIRQTEDLVETAGDDGVLRRLCQRRVALAGTQTGLGSVHGVPLTSRGEPGDDHVVRSRWATVGEHSSRASQLPGGRHDSFRCGGRGQCQRDAASRRCQSTRRIVTECFYRRCEVRRSRSASCHRDQCASNQHVAFDSCGSKLRQFAAPCESW